ncbi:MAG: methyl-accepting chemotaxis protein [Nannocystaceae bacterium]
MSIATQIESAVSEREVLAIGVSLMNILKDSKKRVATCEELLGSVDQDSQMAAEISQQREMMRAYVETTSREAGIQREIAGNAFEYSGQIFEAGQRIDAIARTAKLINVNAQVEAGRLGDEGRSMSVVADEMDRLSSEIGRVSEVVSRLAESLAECMPTLSETSEHLAEHAVDFSIELAQSQEAVKVSQHELQDRMRCLLE